MRAAKSLIMVAVLAMACGQSAGQTQTQASSTPQNVGGATLSETGCNFEISNHLPLHLVSFTLVNKTKYSGRFLFSNINHGSTFQDLIDYWNGPMGRVERPGFVTEIGNVDVPANGSGEMVVPITLPGTYAFSCGYADENAKVTGFFLELNAS
jgi:hypothetical protein